MEKNTAGKYKCASISYTCIALAFGPNETNISLSYECKILPCAFDFVIECNEGLKVKMSQTYGDFAQFNLFSILLLDYLANEGFWDQTL